MAPDFWWTALIPFYRMEALMGAIDQKRGIWRLSLDTSKGRLLIISDPTVFQETDQSRALADKSPCIRQSMWAAGEQLRIGRFYNGRDHSRCCIRSRK
jgi:hypothetical protein